LCVSQRQIGRGITMSTAGGGYDQHFLAS
jgi:hypothetical protein